MGSQGDKEEDSLTGLFILSPDLLFGVLNQGVYVERGEEDLDHFWTTIAFISLFLLSLFYGAGVTVFKVLKFSIKIQ